MQNLDTARDDGVAFHFGLNVLSSAKGLEK